MLVSTTVVSTRIFDPWATAFSLAMLTTLSWICLITSGPTATPHLPIVLAHLGHADAGELAIDEIGAHLPLEHSVAPVARVLENEQAHDHFCAKAAPAARAAQAMALGQSLIGGHHDFFIGQHAIGMDHPFLVKAIDLLGDQLVAEGELCAPRVDHALFLARFTGVSSGRSRSWLSSQISSSASLRFL